MVNPSRVRAARELVAADCDHLQRGFLVVGIVQRVLGGAVDHAYLDVADHLCHGGFDLLPSKGSMAIEIGKLLGHARRHGCEIL